MMALYPKVNQAGGGVKHSAPHQNDQQDAKSVRPQVPADATAYGQNHLKGKMPAGYVSVWCFGGTYDTKKSPTSGGGKKVY